MTIGLASGTQTRPLRDRRHYAYTLLPRPSIRECELGHRRRPEEAKNVLPNPKPEKIVRNKG